MIVRLPTCPRVIARRAGATRMALASLAIVVSSACSVPLMKLPAPGAVAAADGGEALAQATATCRTINSYSAEISVSGKVGGRRLRTRLLAGLEAPASAFLDAPAPFGASIFMFAARDNDATLLLPRDRRVLEHGRPIEVLEAIAGVPLAPADLRLALTGCATRSRSATTGALFQASASSTCIAPPPAAPGSWSPPSTGSRVRRNGAPNTRRSTTVYPKASG